MNVPLDLILTKFEWQVQFKGLRVVSTTGLRLLKARLVRVACRASATFSGASRVLATVVIRGTIGSSSGCGGEEARLSTSLI